MSSDKNNLDGTVSKAYVDAQNDSVRELIKSGVFEVATEQEIDKGVEVRSTSKVTSYFETVGAHIAHCYHPHHDAIRIRVLEVMVERLLEAVEKDPDSSSEVAKLRHDFQNWQKELSDSKVVDRLYASSYEINYNSLPYQLNVSGLSPKPLTNE